MTTTSLFVFLLKMLKYPVSVGVFLETPSECGHVLERFHFVNGTFGTQLFRFVCFKRNQRDMNVVSWVTGQRY